MGGVGEGGGGNAREACSRRGHLCLTAVKWRVIPKRVDVPGQRMLRGDPTAVAAIVLSGSACPGADLDQSLLVGPTLPFLVGRARWISIRLAWFENASLDSSVDWSDRVDVVSMVTSPMGWIEFDADERRGGSSGAPRVRQFSPRGVSLGRG